MIHTIKNKNKTYEYIYHAHGRKRICAICGEQILDVNRMTHVACYTQRKSAIQKTFKIDNVMQKKKDKKYESYKNELAMIKLKKNVFTDKYIEKRTKFLISRINAYQ